MNQVLIIFAIDRFSLARLDQWAKQASFKSGSREAKDCQMRTNEESHHAKAIDLGGSASSDPASQAKRLGRGE